MRRVLNSSGLNIGCKTYYNLIRGKPFNGHSSDSFEGLVLALEEASFKFTYLMSDDLADDGSLKGKSIRAGFLPY